MPDAALMAGGRAAAVAGLAGPCVFTAAWLAGSLAQNNHSLTAVQISGLAAPDARAPWIMITGFELLGGCVIVFGHGLRERAGHGLRGRAGLRGRDGRVVAWLVEAAGLLTMAAGLLRRDHMLLTAGPVSWHNRAHDVISAIIYVDLVVAQALLARRFGRWLLVSAAATAGLLAAFAADTSAPDAGLLQRVLVSVPLVAVAAISVRLLRDDRQPEVDESLPST
jgi:hypothetical protein